ncbi:TIGR04076 family protein [Candidatus Lokiarchaeum ossiferum]|uniref:TIGR04076 family protein n=1 Tax=Candidatus Lokiarchaeum ossiferum TaxID=2951803 RepID=UPI00352F6FA8
MVKGKITVLKRTFHADLAEEYLQTKTGPCGEFEDGQEFIVSSPSAKPESFPCSFAWHDIHKILITLMQGGNFKNYVGKTGKIWKWMKADNAYITCCVDGIRPVIFKIEVFERDDVLN